MVKPRKSDKKDPREGFGRKKEKSNIPGRGQRIQKTRARRKNFLGKEIITGSWGFKNGVDGPVRKGGK